MGYSILPVGLKHKVDTGSMESIAGFLVENFKANVRCRIMNHVWYSDTPVFTDFGFYVCEGSTRNIELVEDKTGNMGCRDNWELFFDWNPFPCYDEELQVRIILFDDLMYLLRLECPDRMFRFTRNYQNDRTDEADEICCREALEKFRRSLMEFARVFGCGKMMYSVKSGMWAKTFARCGRCDSETLTREIEETCSVLDVPAYLSKTKDMLRLAKAMMHFEILLDDFRDTKDNRSPDPLTVAHTDWETK